MSCFLVILRVWWQRISPASAETASLQNLHPLLQEEQHGGVVVLALALDAAVEQVADRIDDDDVGRRVAEAVADGRGGGGDAAGIEQHPHLRRGDQAVACRGDDRRIEADRLDALAQIVVVHLRLQVEDRERPRRGEAEERHAGRHVREQADDEVALADLGRAAQHQHAAGGEQPRRDQVVRHRARVIEQLAEREGGQRRRSGGPGELRGRAVALLVQPPQPLCFRGQPLQRPAGPQHGGVVLADRLPRLVAADPAVVRQADVVADRGAGALEARPVVLPAVAHRGDQHVIDTRLRRPRWRRIGANARQRRHRIDGLGEVA